LLSENDKRCTQGSPAQISLGHPYIHRKVFAVYNEPVRLLTIGINFQVHNIIKANIIKDVYCMNCKTPTHISPMFEYT
jgi:hypothetical protein